MIRSLLIAVFSVFFAAPALATTVEIFSNTLEFYNQGTFVESAWEVFIPDDNFTSVFGVQDLVSFTGPFVFDPDTSFSPTGEWFSDSDIVPGPVGTLNEVFYTAPGENGNVNWLRQTAQSTGGVPTFTNITLSGSSVFVDWSCNGGCAAGSAFTSMNLDVLLFNGEEEELVFTVQAGDPVTFDQTGTFEFTGIAPGEYELAIEIFTHGVDPSFNPTGPATFLVHEEASRLNGGFGITVVPEPSTGLMMGAGLFGLALVGRKRKL